MLPACRPAFVKVISTTQIRLKITEFLIPHVRQINAIDRNGACKRRHAYYSVSSWKTFHLQNTRNEWQKTVGAQFVSDSQYRTQLGFVEGMNDYHGECNGHGMSVRTPVTALWPLRRHEDISNARSTVRLKQTKTNYVFKAGLHLHWLHTRYGKKLTAGVDKSRVSDRPGD